MMEVILNELIVLFWISIIKRNNSLPTNDIFEGPMNDMYILVYNN